MSAALKAATVRDALDDRVTGWEDSVAELRSDDLVRVYDAVEREVLARLRADPVAAMEELGLVS